MARRVAVAMAVVLVSSGCLTIPNETKSDGGASDASTSDAPLPDAPFNVCGNKSAFTGQAFPPAREIGIRDVYPADLNNDGYIDLVLTNSGVANQDDWGFFVLLGPQTDPNNLEYHAFIPTNIAPQGVAIKDVLGSEGGCLDVAVWGVNKADNAGVVEVYQWDGSPDLFDADTPVSKGALFRPEQSGPILIAFGDWSGAGHGNDIAICDLFELRILNVTTDFANSLPIAPVREIGSDGTTAPAGGWDAINGMYARASVRSGGTADDLVVVENQGMSWLHNDGAGGFSTPAPVTASSSGMWNSTSVHVVDLDKTGPLDFIGAGGNSFGGYLISQSGQTVTITTRPWGNIFGEVFNEIYGVTVADLGGGADAPEFVAIDEGNGAGNRGFAYLVDTMSTDATNVTPMGYQTHDFTSTGINFRHVRAVDFNGDQRPELMVFTLDGRSRCLQRKQGIGELEACP